MYASYHAWDLPREKFEEVKNLEKEMQKLKEDEINKLIEQNTILIRR